jgi:hypothetical protein
MAIEILLEEGRTFHHALRHKLESLFFVIIWICSHMEGPQVERKEIDKLTIRNWFSMESSLRSLGHTKLAHIEDMQRVILPEIPSYWDDFKPFISNLKTAFFPSGAVKPNCITPERMVEILEEALKAVEEPQSSDSPAEPVIEMHEYDVLKYGKEFRRGQAEAPRKRIKFTRASPPVTRSTSARQSQSYRSSGRPTNNVSKPSKLRNSSASHGQEFGATV